VGKDKKKEEKFFGEQREASCRNGEEKGRKKERAGEDGQAAETEKKKGKPEGAKLLRNELEGRNKFEKGDGRFTKKQKQRGDFRVRS